MKSVAHDGCSTRNRACGAAQLGRLVMWRPRLPRDHDDIGRLWMSEELDESQCRWCLNTPEAAPDYQP